MPAVAIGTLLVSAYAARQQKDAAKDSTNAITDASSAANAEQARQYDQTRQDQMPWLEAGRNALALQGAALKGDFSGFENSPDYAFALQQGLKGLDRSASSRGALYSGGHDADTMQFAQGLASQNFGNYWNRLAGMAGQGQQTAGQIGQFGQNYAGAVGNNLLGAANARASSYQARADANSQLAGSIGNAFGQWYGSNSANNGGGTGWYLGSKPGRG